MMAQLELHPISRCDHDIGMPGAGEPESERNLNLELASDERAQRMRG